MPDLDLIFMQLRLECKGLDARGLLVRIPGPDPDEIARFSALVYCDGELRLFRDDVPPEVEEALRAIPTPAVFDVPEWVRQVFAAFPPVATPFVGVSYVFPRELTPDDFPDAVAMHESARDLIRGFDSGLRASEDRPVHAVVLDGRIVSACVSSRENREAGEAWVQTRPEFRGRGYARQAVAAWAHRLQRRGKVAFYSHHCDNQASRGVARSLDLRKFVDFASFE